MAATALSARPEASIPRWGWQEQASCRGVDLALFFGRDNEPRPERLDRERRAVQLCRTCPVLDICHEHALAQPERYGVWGGTTEEAREEERREGRIRVA